MKGVAYLWELQCFANIIYSNCQVTVTLQLLKMTLESIETSSKSFIIIINFIIKTSIFLLKRKASQISSLLFLIFMLLSFKYLPRFYTTSVTAFEKISSTIIHFNHDRDPHGSSFYTYHVWIKATYLPNWQDPLLKTTPPKVVCNSSPPLMVWRSSSL